jgi:ribosomal-protein-alanine N-acetyltransferase
MFCIRDYRPDDLPELWRLDQECFAPGIAYSEAELRQYLKSRGAFALVAHDREGAILGFAVAQVRLRGAAERASGPRAQAAARREPGPGCGAPVRRGHVITIDVRSHGRRAGVGSALMDCLEARLRGSGCACVSLETAVDNAAALAFYERRGFAVRQVIPRYYGDQVDAFLMGKRLR